MYDDSDKTIEGFIYELNSKFVFKYKCITFCYVESGPEVQSLRYRLRQRLTNFVLNAYHRKRIVDSKVGRYRISKSRVVSKLL